MANNRLHDILAPLEIMRRSVRSKDMHEKTESLIPELKEIRSGGKGIDLTTWLTCIGRFDHALAYASIFWPDFTEHDDCIFLKPPGEELYRSWLNQCQGNNTRVEGTMNHRHLVDLFHNSTFTPTKEIIIQFGEVLKDMWTCKLKRDFPKRQFAVNFIGEDNGDLSEYQITFYQE